MYTHGNTPIRASKPNTTQWWHYICHNRHQYGKQACDYVPFLNVIRTDEMARQCLRALIRQPDKLLKGAQAILEEQIEGGGLSAQVEHREQRVKAIEATIKKTQQRTDTGFYSEAEGTEIIVRERQKLNEAQQMAAQARSSG